MNDKQFRQLETYHEIVRWFGRCKTPIAPEAPAVVERLAATLGEIEATGSTQLSLALERGRTAARGYLEQMRDKQMIPLAKMARKLFRDQPRIRTGLRVPHKRANAETLLAAAEAMVKTLAEHRELLAAGRVDLARLDKLEKETAAVRKRFELSGTLVADRAVPTRRLVPLFRNAADDVDILRSLVATSDPVAERPAPTMWRVRKRLGRPKTRRKKK